MKASVSGLKIPQPIAKQGTEASQQTTQTVLASAAKPLAAIRDGFEAGAAGALSSSASLIRPAMASKPLEEAATGPQELSFAQKCMLKQAAMDNFIRQETQKFFGELKQSAATNREKLKNLPGFQRLSSAEQERLLKEFGFATAPGVVNFARDLASLFNSEGFESLSSAEQAKALRHFISLFDSQGFQSLIPDQKREALKVFYVADNEGRAELVKLADRQVNGKSAFLDADKDGNTLLSSLHLLATQPLNAEINDDPSVTRKTLLYGVMQEAANPGEVTQGSHGTCTVTSMQYMLCKQNPAEYVRIMQGLTSIAGEVVSRGGQTIHKNAGSVARDGNNGRSDSERIFQAAMMEFCNGSDNYDNRSDSSTNPQGGNSYPGLSANQEVKGLEALFGRNFKIETQKIIELLTQRSNEGQLSFVDMAWGDKKKGGHSLVVEKVENGRVYFRNPWGQQSHRPNGSEHENPPRRMEDNTFGLESMSLADFEKWVKNCLI